MSHHSISRFAALLAMTMTVFAGESHAETVTDSERGFTLNLPTGFVPRVDLIGATPDIVHAFEFGEAKEGSRPPGRTPG